MKKIEERKMPLVSGHVVVEGVHIMSKNYSVVCIRKADGSIHKHTERLNSLYSKFRILRFPFIRAIYAFFETWYVEIKAFYRSINARLKEEEKMKPLDMVEQELTSLTRGITFFAILPFFTTLFLNLKGLAFNVFEGVLRLLIFFFFLIRRHLAESFKRMLQYHGAEHMAINVLESGGELTKEKAKTKKRFHPQCGSPFFLIVIPISIFVFSVMPDLGWAINFSYRILLIPIIFGISYEIMGISNKYKKSKIMKAFVKLSLWLQRLTTKEPTEDMVDVALEAVKEVIRLEAEGPKALASFSIGR